MPPAVRRIPWPWRLWALAAVLLLACRGSVPAAKTPPARNAPPPAGDDARQGARADRAATAGPAATGPEEEHAAPSAGAPLDAVVFVTGGADDDDRLPLVVLIHGLGDRPERFAHALDGFPVRARVAAPRAPTPWHDGGSWFPVRARDPDREALARGVAAAADRVAAWIRRTTAAHPTAGKPVITGFSQGGILAFAVAVRHPDLVAAAVPVGGLLPEPLYPDALPPSPPPIVALHGEDDRTVAFERARATVEHLARLGWPAHLESFPGVGHAIPPPVHRAWLDALERAVAGRLAPP